MGLALKKDNLWVKWCHEYYFKNMNLWQYREKESTSWVIKKVLKLRPQARICIHLTTDALEFKAAGAPFSTSSTYAQLCGQASKVDWYSLVWNRFAFLKHSFISWLVYNNRLTTKDRLIKFGVQTNPKCGFCGMAEETRDHIFFKCPPCFNILRSVLNLVHLQSPSAN
eukprot:TRINITY_DN8357_c0_g1_i2.p1 TRINITY_DN8357_c0_g1~~TRINITY_DN8357_c0_g1_i2.p1  ORF type:complete len:168 (+),score=8.16 TRINITY_DN8357_c0_g1_i2:519-1022(+)